MTETSGQLFVKKILGECTPDEEQQFLDWISESEENKNAYLQYKMLWQARKLKTYSDDKFLETARDKFNSRIDLINANDRRIRVYKYVRYAVIFLVLIGLPALFWYVKSCRNDEKLLTVTVAMHGPIKLISLADGTRVQLNNGSTLICPVEFTKKERTIRIEGEAFLEVKKDAFHPFVVKTGSVQIKVLGTSFNVNTRCEGNIIQVTLVEGSVELLDNMDEVIASLKPGQMAAIDNKSMKLIIKDVNTKEYISWQKGIVSIENASLNEIVSKIEEVYNIRIKIDLRLLTQKQIQKKYNFVFRRSQPVDTVFEMLKFLAPVNYIKKNKLSETKNEKHPGKILTNVDTHEKQ